MIEFTFMGRRYGLFAARLSTLGMPDGDPVPAVQSDLEAAGYQPFTRLADQPAPTETAFASVTVLASAHGTTRSEAVADARQQLAKLDEKRAALLMLLDETTIFADPEAYHPTSADKYGSDSIALAAGQPPSSLHCHGCTDDMCPGCCDCSG